MALAGPPVDGAFTRGGIRPRWSDLGWALGQPLRRYAAWAAELGAAGAIAAAGMTPFGQASGNAAGGEAQRLEVTAEAAVWLAAVCLLVALLRIHDPLRQSGGWGEAMARARRLARAHPLIVAVSVPVLLVGRSTRRAPPPRASYSNCCNWSRSWRASTSPASPPVCWVGGLIR